MLSASVFDYEFPRDLIAQHPARNREDSRLLQLDRATSSITHRRFSEFPSLLCADDVLVINASRVIKARLRGVRDNGREAEVLLVHAVSTDTWLVMVHPGGKLKEGRKISFGNDAVIEIVEVVGGGLRRAQLTGLTWNALMERYGNLPLPPYIDRAATEEDAARYQTVYAHVDGSVAAPTAGLHFTAPMLDAIRAQGVNVVEVLLHIGPGTFKPVETDELSHHVMHSEWYRVSREAAETVNDARAAGHRIWAVGTTVARVLETVGAGGTVRAEEGWTKLFIHPPYEFRAVDGLLTNFHLPRSTLLMLVCALGGVEQVMAAYRSAITERYRLFSYGDPMAIV